MAQARPGEGVDYSSAGWLELSDQQRALLRAKVDPALVEIRPDGIVYQPWPVIWSRLLDAFHPFVPALVPLSKPVLQDGRMCTHYGMWVARIFVGEAVGECPYRPGNPNMSYASAAEGSVSDAVTRIGKRLGIGLELWSPTWRNWWIREYAVRVWVQPRGREGTWQWRRKDAPHLPGESKPGRGSEAIGARKPDYKEQAEAHIEAIQEG